MVTPSGLVLLTDRRLAPVIPVVTAAIRGGAGWVVLRERDLPYADRADLAHRLRDIVPAGRLIVAGPDPLGGTAVHLSASDPPPRTPVALVGRSRHGAVSAADEDYVTLSPIYPTKTKPGYGPPLGPVTAARHAGAVPWLALGGVDSAQRAAACAVAGAAGIAVLGAVSRAADPEAVTAELAAAVAAAKPPGGECGSGPPGGECGSEPTGREREVSSRDGECGFGSGGSGSGIRASRSGCRVGLGVRRRGGER